MSSDIYTIKSPLMGTFYRASAPGEPPLVEEGQIIEASQVVCIIESMKIFTEIRSEHTGIVAKILVANEDLVKKNQDIIEISRTD